MPLQRSVISLVEADAVVRRALDEAVGRSIQVAVVVADPWGEPVATARMDGVSAMTALAAAGKARTAAAFGVPTSTWQERSAVDPAFPAAVGTVAGFTPLAGGDLVRASGVVIGAVGVSGGTEADDAAIAAAAGAVS